jgi:hypothetical protein
MPTEKLGEKESVVKLITKVIFNEEHQKDNYGNLKYKVEMEDGTRGVYATKGAPWNTGEKVRFSLSKWTSDDGTQETLYIKPITPNKGAWNRPAPQKGAKDYKAEAVIAVGREVVGKCIPDNKLGSADFKKTLDYFNGIIAEKIDQVYADN